jgi:hypothetical protein
MKLHYVHPLPIAFMLSVSLSLFPLFAALERFPSLFFSSVLLYPHPLLSPVLILVLSNRCPSCNTPVLHPTCSLRKHPPASLHLVSTAILLSRLSPTCLLLSLPSLPP